MSYKLLKQIRNFNKKIMKKRLIHNKKFLRNCKQLLKS